MVRWSAAHTYEYYVRFLIGRVSGRKIGNQIADGIYGIYAAVKSGSSHDVISNRSTSQLRGLYTSHFVTLVSKKWKTYIAGRMFEHYVSFIFDFPITGSLAAVGFQLSMPSRLCGLVADNLCSSRTRLHWLLVTTNSYCEQWKKKRTRTFEKR